MNQALISVLRRDTLAIFQAGVAAADPYRAVKNTLKFENGHLTIGIDQPHDNALRTHAWKKIHVIAFGKAACAMATAAVEIIPPSQLAGRAFVVTNYENASEAAGCEVLKAGHPLPDTAGQAAAQNLIERLLGVEAGDLVLTLISGGGSALIPCPAEGITLDEKIAVTQLLLASGANINEMNCVRKHLSQLKGGGLAKLAAPADLHALILSDVLGDDLSAIASGPTVPDPSTFADAIRILKDRSLWGRCPESIRMHLLAGSLGNRPETPKPGDPLFARCGYTLIGSNTLSLAAATEHARTLGYETVIYDDHLCGVARDAAGIWAEKLATTKSQQKPVAWLAGGETTVAVKGKGLGGRNQEFALAFALAAEKHAIRGNWTFLSAGTDGRDGPTDAAGGCVDSGSIARMRLHNVNPDAYLDDNDSYHALRTAGDLVDTGATGTNVADLQIALLHPK